jgi:hypothetical protein
LVINTYMPGQILSFTEFLNESRQIHTYNRASEAFDKFIIKFLNLKLVKRYKLFGLGRDVPDHEITKDTVPEELTLDVYSDGVGKIVIIFGGTTISVNRPAIIMSTANPKFTELATWPIELRKSDLYRDYETSVSKVNSSTVKDFVIEQDTLYDWKNRHDLIPDINPQKEIGLIELVSKILGGKMTADYHALIFSITHEAVGYDDVFDMNRIRSLTPARALTSYGFEIYKLKPEWRAKAERFAITLGKEHARFENIDDVQKIGNSSLIIYEVDEYGSVKTVMRAPSGPISNNVRIPGFRYSGNYLTLREIRTILSGIYNHFQSNREWFKKRGVEFIDNMSDDQIKDNVITGQMDKTLGDLW